MTDISFAQSSNSELAAPRRVFRWERNDTRSSQPRNQSGQARLESARGFFDVVQIFILGCRNIV